MKNLDESLLSGLPPFSRLSRPQIREILDQASPKRHEQGVEVFHKGEEAERFFLLLDSTVRAIKVTSTGEQVILRHIPAGQLIVVAIPLGRTT